MNLIEIVNLARDKNWIIFGLMVIAFVFFAYHFVKSLKSESVKSKTILKFAPMVMTGLGLFGTFFELTHALSGFDVTTEKVKAMVGDLKSVFTFSILGIGSAIMFMIANFFVQSKQNAEIKLNNQQAKENWEKKQARYEKNTEYTIFELQTQSKSLKQLENLTELTQLLPFVQQQQIFSQTTKEWQIGQFNVSKAQYELQKHQGDIQKQTFDNINQQLANLAQSIQSIETGYDMEKLGQVVADKMSEVLAEPLREMTNALKNNNQDVIKQLLIDLKQEVLIPIQQEIKQSNNNVLSLTQAVQASKDTNDKMIETVEWTVKEIKLFGEQTKNLVVAMDTTMSKMDSFQQNQQTMFSQFNDKLSDNLNKIQPAIENGMKSATNDMKSAIDIATDNMKTTITGLSGVMSATLGDMRNLNQEQKQSLEQFNTELSKNLAEIQPAIETGMQSATDKMNQVLTESTNNMKQTIEQATRQMNTTLSETSDSLSRIVAEISNNVLVDLRNILNGFNSQMDSHLNRMNQELEETGNRASKLMNQTADNLKESLGTIHETIEQSSQKLQEELESFRNEYDRSLTAFFEKQNQALEQTLGLQRERLQATADQLRDQFEKMKQQQEQLNKESGLLLDKFRPVYESLLNQMANISTELSTGQQRLIKDLRETTEHTHKVNQALEQLGKDLPKAFNEAFTALNDQYIKKFNESNQAIEKIMKEMIVSAGALLTTVQLNQKHDD